jgi:cysteine desulfurase/selenocysteine lyase
VRREDFPALTLSVNGRPLVYLDSASTTQKPQVVLDAVQQAMLRAANIHRGVHRLSEENTEAYESVRTLVQRLLDAPHPDEVVFTRGTTEAINLVAHGWARRHLGPGDEVLLTELEHHSNIVPWQQAARATGATLRVVPIEEEGRITAERVRAHITDRTRLVAFSHVSNAIGTILPAKEIVAAARDVGACTLIDGAQAVPHLPVSVRELGCDFYCFSGHKMYGPTGAGVLWARMARLESMDPFQGGGDMIAEVHFDHTTYNDIPHRFEAGTPDVVGVIGLGAAIDWWLDLDHAAMAREEDETFRALREGLDAMDGIRVLGPDTDATAAVSFLLEGVHPHDVGTALDAEGVAVRTGMHCTQPLMRRLDVPGTVRASIGVYNDRRDVNALLTGLESVKNRLT